MAAKTEFFVLGHEFDTGMPFPQGVADFLLAGADTRDDTQTGYNNTTHNWLPRNYLWM
jgi:hypothetical protein